MSSMPGAHGTSPDTDHGSWTTGEFTCTGQGDGSAHEPVDQSLLGFNLLKGFSGIQKKITRDGQPAKRRGPKPDSKPAQTRRQELNRQAQRTHRERKEQYIKALEIEVSRLREVFVDEQKTWQGNLEQHQIALHELQQENHLLKDMLASNGIHFEGELEARKVALGIQPNVPQAPVGPNITATRPPAFQTVVSGSKPAPGYQIMSEQGYTNGQKGSLSGSVSAHSPYNHSTVASSPPLLPEPAIKQEVEPVSDMPGVFEQDPQLGVEFILALEATCRGHGEYLVRRSVDSPDTIEEAQFSGHALMASCPPPSHIANTPPQMGGLTPTYDHRVPDLPTSSLNTLLNLSQKIKAEGYVEGGQVTPIMALHSLRGHRHYPSLTREDVLGMIEVIRNKVRCYGFGAVMEDFELRDALSSVFATKPETYEGLPEIEDMYS